MANKASETKAVATVGANALARPSFITQGDHRGTETIERDDLQMPRLSLAQALSPELDPTSPKYIDGLKVGDAFNSLTGEVYGRSPIEVVIIRAEKARWIEFDEKNRGQIKDFNVAPGDPRTQFTTDAQGNTVKPAATKFAEYIAVLLPAMEPIALSFKGAGLKTAKTLNGLMKLANEPAFALRYVLTPAIQKDPASGGTYAVFNIKYAPKEEGQTKPYVSEELYKFCSSLYDSYSGKSLGVEREPGQDDDEPIAPGTGF
jgi:hypothetical protein